MSTSHILTAIVIVLILLLLVILTSGNSYVLGSGRFMHIVPKSWLRLFARCHRQSK